ncbi:MAG TPA: TraB/GumN family protein [Opitutales bacterium]|nr:TraB/GumN family protein [Opitutales bacterium]
MSIEVLNGFKPGMAVMMLTVQELMKIGVTQEGVDMVFAKRAKADGKPVRALETAEFQIDLITAIGEGMEDEFVRYSLRDLHQIEKLFDELIRAWREGDNEALERLFVDDMREFPQVYEGLLADRNERWMKDLEKMLATDEVEFALVGAGHLVGPDGLLQSFQKMGCEVEVLDVATSK